MGGTPCSTAWKPSDPQLLRKRRPQNSGLMGHESITTTAKFSTEASAQGSGCRRDGDRCVPFPAATLNRAPAMADRRNMLIAALNPWMWWPIAIFGVVAILGMILKMVTMSGNFPLWMFWPMQVAITLCGLTSFFCVVIFLGSVTLRLFSG